MEGGCEGARAKRARRQSIARFISRRCGSFRVSSSGAPKKAERRAAFGMCASKGATCCALGVHYSASQRGCPWPGCGTIAADGGPCVESQ
jgi:hypothetical protein